MVENGRNSLDCCVVRDLLPAYLEGLTEEETSAQVRAHLEGCENCRELEKDMRAQVPLEKAPKGTLKFLKRVKRTRLLAAALSVVVALWCMWWLYDQEFHYPNTEAGRLAAVEDYVSRPSDSRDTKGVQEGTPIHVGGWQEIEGQLAIFFKADNRNNVNGIVLLKRGIFGKYRPVSASYSPSPYTAGVYCDDVGGLGTDRTQFMIAGYGCREILSAQLEFWGGSWDGIQRWTTTRTYDLEEPDFLWLYDQEELIRDLGWEFGDGQNQVFWLDVREIRLLDREGNDITGRYRDGSVTESWGGGIGTAEQFLLYVYMGIIALLGLTMVRYFLRKD